MTTLDEATSELKGMLEKCMTDDSVYIFENALQPFILNHGLSTFDNRFIETTKILPEFSIGSEHMVTTRTSSQSRTIYDDPSCQQSNFNATKDISSYKPKQVLEPLQRQI
ncbi:hypothetical protein BPOR_0067g00300 [Botrytis porri]|uniref:Uncharacterized protein n=1 Tax=Botrytis porri TaxID=87229 RepID=A0A4Z1L0R3_9HELO|nr:hypothetical protein BPOR_0067g00300 [Botrytis porri]